MHQRSFDRARQAIAQPEAPTRSRRSSNRLQDTLGNRGMAEHLRRALTLRPAPAKLEVGAVDHPLEREADELADRALAPGLGIDLSSVQVHRGPEASAAARALGAEAFNVGRHIVLGADAPSQSSAAGRRLIGHELVHVAQRAAGQVSPGTILRQAKGEESKPALLKASEIFPFPKGAKIMMVRVLGDLLMGIFDMRVEDEHQKATDLETAARKIAEDPNADETAKQTAKQTAESARWSATAQAQTARMLKALDQKEATVTETGDDTFEAVVSGSHEVPAAGAFAQDTLADITLSLERSSDNMFDFRLRGTSRKPDGSTEEQEIFRRRREISRDAAGNIEFSFTDKDNNKVTESQIVSDSSGARILKYVEPSLGITPEVMKFVELPAQPEAREQVKKAIEDQATEDRKDRSSRFTMNIGVIATGQTPERTGATEPDTAWDPLLAFSWQYNFHPADGYLRNIFQVPVYISLDYNAAGNTFLATAASGLEASFNPIVPINVHILAGVGGGQLSGTGPRDDRPQYDAFGPVVGAGTGVEIDSFRLDVRYQYLFNLLGSADFLESLPGAHMFTIGMGYAP